MRTTALTFAVLVLVTAPRAATVASDGDAPQVRYAAELLRAATGLGELAVSLKITGSGSPESFTLVPRGNREVVIRGADPAGVLYGALELIEHGLPRDEVSQSPAFSLRGHCMAVISATSYDQPITHETAPWFYDKAYWTRELDLCRDCRFNALYIWSKHPFPYLLRLPHFPEAQELPDAELDENIAMFQWITAEAEKRNVTIMFVIYNIFVSHAFAAAHGIPVDNAFWSPLLVDYTKECVSEFVKNYPSVSLVICAGEALQERKPQWVADVILPAIKSTGKHPPVVVRGWQLSPGDVERVILPAYDNLYTMSKYNGELLTSPHYMEPANERYIRVSPLHIVNIHLVSNLNPYRWFDPDFVRECMAFCRDQGARGLHVYPLEFWSWPYTMDDTEPPLFGIERDRLWYEAWGRYSWNPDRAPAAERAYWTRRVAERFGIAEEGIAETALDAMERMSRVMPLYNRSFSSHPGNGSAHSLGETLYQLMWESRRDFTPDPGETLRSYARKIAAGSPVVGESPLANAARMVELADVGAPLEAVWPHVTRGRDEFLRWQNDARCLSAFARHTEAKVEAAVETLLYHETLDRRRLAIARERLGASLRPYAELVERSNGTYRAASGLRWYRYKPYSVLLGVDHWRDVLPRFEAEEHDFAANVEFMRDPSVDAYERNVVGSHPEVPARLLLYDKTDLEPDGLREKGPWLAFELGYLGESQGYWWADGITVAVDVVADGTTERVWTETLHTIEWRPRLISLERWQGRRITLRLVALPHGGSESEHILWGNARVLAGALPARVSFLVPPPNVRVVADLVERVKRRQCEHMLLSPSGERLPWGGWAGASAGDSRGGSDTRPAIYQRPPYAPGHGGEASALQFTLTLP